MKRYKTKITLTENQIEALNSVFDWLVPHRDEYVDTEYKANIVQIDKKLYKAVEEINFLKNLQKRREYKKNGGDAFLSKIIMESRGNE